jgi:DNA mismatch repair protein MutS2
LFVEPQRFVELNNRLKIAAGEGADEERRILTELSLQVGREVDAILASLDVAEELDVLDGAARLADDLHAAPPVIGEVAGPLALVAARHPLMALSERTCVPNDIHLPAGATLVVSGPNAGGKTVALKTAGLAALCVRAGLHVAAASDSQVPWFRAVHTDIGDDQSLERDLSTFGAHILRLRETIADADEATLVLIDEVAVGTAPEQGAALAQAVLEALADRGARAIVTTHYERVKAIAGADARFRNASVGFDRETMQPTFRLHIGTPGSSGALYVARRLGLPEAVVTRAEELLGAPRASVDDLLAEIADQRAVLAQERARVAALEREAAQAHRAAELAQKSAAEREAKLRAGAYGDAVAALRRARDELDELRSGLKKRRVVVAAEARQQVERLAQEIARNAPPPPPAVGAPPTAAVLVPGTRVFVASLGRVGEVMEAPRRGKVVVEVGAVRTIVPVEGLRLDSTPRRVRSAPAKPSARVPRGRAREDDSTGPIQDDALPARSVDNTLDLRGERVDDALAQVDRFLDESMLAVRDVVVIIHGHGTGALRNALRQHIKQHPALKRWRAGTPQEGGDGITVAWLDVG